MYKAQSDTKKMTAIQFMRSFDDTLAKIESIGDKTVVEQKAMLESAQPYTNKEGLFEMAEMLGVNTSDENEQQLWNSEQPELNNVDKNLIVEELAEMLKHMHEDVIDFSDIGPIATVIQNKLGYKVNLDDYITNMITGASDWQDSQSFAHGKEAPGVEDAEHAGFSGDMTPERTPTDIAPNESGTESNEMGDVGGLAGAVSAALGGGMGGIEGGDLDSLENEGLEGSEFNDLGDDLDGDVDDLEGDDLDGDVDDLEGDDLDGDVDDLEGDDLDGDIDDLEGDDLEGDDLDGDVDDLEGDDLDEDEDDLENMLESIKSNYLDKESGKILVEAAALSLSKESIIDLQLESIREGLFESVKKNLIEEDEGDLDAGIADEAGAEGDMDALNEAAINEAYEELKSKAKLEAAKIEKKAQFEATKKVTSVLESIANGYHSKEQAKIEAIQAEQMLDVKLESIAQGFHARAQALTEAEQAEKALDEKLKSLVESYSESQAPAANVKARLEARQKIQGIK